MPSPSRNGIVAPHAGLMYSGPIAAHAYRLLYGRDIEIAVLVGPSHYVGFEGAAIYERGAFETPFGPIPISEPCAAAVARASRAIGPHPTAHVRRSPVPALMSSLVAGEGGVLIPSDRTSHRLASDGTGGAQ